MAIALAVVGGMVVGWGWCRLAYRYERHQAEAERRIGWNYGYGQGVVDGKRGVYRPGAPPDGRAWKGVRP